MNEPVKLKNGSEELDVLVSATMLSLRTLMQENPIAAFELVELCRDPAHKLFGNTRSDLEALSLVGRTADPDGPPIVHDSIRHIVLSAAEGEGLELTFGNPLAETPAPA